MQKKLNAKKILFSIVHFSATTRHGRPTGRLRMGRRVWRRSEDGAAGHVDSGDDLGLGGRSGDTPDGDVGLEDVEIGDHSLNVPILDVGDVAAVLLVLVIPGVRHEKWLNVLLVDADKPVGGGLAGAVAKTEFKSVRGALAVVVLLDADGDLEDLEKSARGRPEEGDGDDDEDERRGQDDRTLRSLDTGCEHERKRTAQARPPQHCLVLNRQPIRTLSLEQIEHKRYRNNVAGAGE